MSNAVEYIGASVDVNGLLSAAIGAPVSIVDPLDPASAVSTLCTNMTVKYDGDVTTTVGSDSASYENDTYDVGNDFSVTRNESTPSTTQALSRDYASLNSTVSGISETVTNLPTFSWEPSSKVLTITLAG